MDIYINNTYATTGGVGKYNIRIMLYGYNHFKMKIIFVMYSKHLYLLHSVFVYRSCFTSILVRPRMLTAVCK